MGDSSVAVVDLFCGIGGLSYGFINAGLRVVAGIDIDPLCEYPFTANAKARFVHRGVEHVPVEELNDLYPPNAVRVLAGCAPCQPFSTYNRKRTSDGNWALLREFVRLIDGSLPDIVSMENVPRIRHHPVFHSFLECLERNGYATPAYGVMSCAEFGVPQSRKRLVVIASRFGEIKLPEATHQPDTFVSVRDVIGSLPPIEAGESQPNDPIHFASSLSPLNMLRIRATKPGGSWRDWPSELVAPCHRRQSGKSYPSVYGRMSWDDLAPTITTQFHGYGNGRFGHPEQDRALSLREGALLQTFPPRYRFVRPDATVQVSPMARLIGNAVPVGLAEAIGARIVEHVQEVADR